MFSDENLTVEDLNVLDADEFKSIVSNLKLRCTIRKRVADELARTSKDKKIVCELSTLYLNQQLPIQGDPQLSPPYKC